MMVSAGQGDDAALGLLQFSVGFFAGALELPDAAERAGGAGEFDLGGTFAGVAAHDGVRIGDVAVARGASVERERDRIEERGLAGTGRPGDCEQAGVGERGRGEVDGVLTLQGVQIRKREAKNFHEAASTFLAASVSCRPLINSAKVWTRAWPSAEV